MRSVVIGGVEYQFVKIPHDSCKDCDILKDSHIAHPHQYPLCFTHNTRGKETDSDFGLIVNLCARHKGYLWKKTTK